MADENKVFSKKSIEDKQRIAREDYEKKIVELRKSFEEVAGTPSGEKVLRYLFILTGGDFGSVRRDKEGNVSVNETLVTLGAKNVWETIRFNLSSETLKRVERHNWEDQK
jgi:hypothetical protein